MSSNARRRDCNSSSVKVLSFDEKKPWPCLRNSVRRLIHSQALTEIMVSVLIGLALALCMGTLKFVFSLLTHERDADESDKDNWRIHGGE